MFGLSKYLIGGSAIALALSLAWGMRVDHLRADWKGKYEILSQVSGDILVSVRRAAGSKSIKLVEAAEQIDLISTSRKAWMGTAKLQSSRIDEISNETLRLKALNAELRQKAEAAIAKRDTAIKRLATEALTPGERTDCAKQLFDAEAALDLVYQQGL